MELISTEASQVEGGVSATSQPNTSACGDDERLDNGKYHLCHVPRRFRLWDVRPNVCKKTAVCQDIVLRGSTR